ncbi:hypothetical protein GCM10028796_59090 [Ramlibacter monticola]|uniref:Uncharacterized protein n=1 Tax=Ramlibacter monticola TaxID=1926872 RepID=A0A936Z5G6_9BURK|nr:hypothetical protein [Ramlibacter monticola]MBL0393952.1 hypothetical protein [Ramlibacter monticola]
MNENQRKDPAEAEGDARGKQGQEDGRAKHGYRNEVSWDDGKGAQPYANQEAQVGPAAGRETEGGNRGDASGRNFEQMEQLRRKPEPPETEVPREDATRKGGVS